VFLLRWGSSVVHDGPAARNRPEWRLIVTYLPRAAITCPLDLVAHGLKTSIPDRRSRSWALRSMRLH